MINATFTIKTQSINETHDGQGVKIAYGECKFFHYSKDGVVEDIISYRAKGSTAVSIAEAGVNSCGVVIGYLDLEVKDTGKGYKSKLCTLVIRNFIPTTTANTTLATTAIPTTFPMPLEPQNIQQPVGTGADVVHSNGYLNTTDSSNIPF
jgi:hypothetical protein